MIEHERFFSIIGSSFKGRQQPKATKTTFKYAPGGMSRAYTDVPTYTGAAELPKTLTMDVINKAIADTDYAIGVHKQNLDPDIAAKRAPTYGLSADEYIKSQETWISKHGGASEALNLVKAYMQENDLSELSTEAAQQVLQNKEAEQALFGKTWQEMGPTERIKAIAGVWPQAGMAGAAKMGEGMGVAVEPWQEYYSKPFAAQLTLPAYAGKPEFKEKVEAELAERAKEGKGISPVEVAKGFFPFTALHTEPIFEKGGVGREEYEKLPEAAKIGAEIAVEVPLFMGGAAGAGIGKASIKGTGTAAKWARGTLTWGAGAVEKPKPTEAAAKLTKANIMPDVQEIDLAIEVATKPTNIRNLANISVGKRQPFKPLARFLEGLSAVAETPAEKAAVGRAALRFEVTAKSLGAWSTLRQYGTSAKVFALSQEQYITKGPLAGKEINEVLTYSSRYWRKLTPQQRNWVKAYRTLREAKNDFLLRHGIDINMLQFDEGGEWVGRKVAGKFDAQNNLIDYAFVGAGPKRVGARAAFEYTRVFRDINEARAAGYMYLPAEDTAYLNTLAAYHRVVDRQFAQYILDRAPWRTLKAPDELKSIKLLMTDNFNAADSLLKTLNRGVRGERIAIPKNAKVHYPEYAKEIQQLVPEVHAGKPTATKVQDLTRRLKLLVDGRKGDLNDIKAQIASANKQLKHVGYTERMLAGYPAFGGKAFTGPEASETAKVLRSFLEPEFSPELNAINQINAIGRYFALAGDASPFTIQLLFLPFTNPQKFPKVVAGFARAVFDPDFAYRYLANPENMQVIRESPNLLLPMHGATEFTEAMARGGWLRVGPLKGMGQLLTPAQRGFETSLTIAGVELKKSFRYLATSPERNAIVDSFINKFRGLVSAERIGVSLKQRQWEKALILAPQYTRAIGALMLDVFRGGLTGSLARQAMLRALSGGVGMTFAISLALGEDIEDIVDHLNPTSPRFMTWNIAGQNIGPGSKLRSVIYLLGNLYKNPDKAGELSMDNPFIRFVRGQLAPAGSTGWDIMSGRNFIGEPTRDGMAHLSRTLFAENLLPIWVQSVAIEGGGDFFGRGIRGMGEFMGLRTYPMSPFQQIVEATEEHISQLPAGMIWADQKQRFEQGILNFDDLNQQQISYLSATFPEFDRLWEEYREQKALRDPDYAKYKEKSDELEEKYNERVIALSKGVASGDVSIREWITTEADESRKRFDILRGVEWATEDMTTEELEEWRQENYRPEDLAYEEFRTIRSDIPQDEHGRTDWDKWRKNQADYLKKVDKKTRLYIEDRMDDYIAYLPTESQSIAKLVYEAENYPDLRAYYNIPKEDSKARRAFRRGNPEVDARLFVLGRVSVLYSTRAVHIAFYLGQSNGIPIMPQLAE